MSRGFISFLPTNAAYGITNYVAPKIARESIEVYDAYSKYNEEEEKDRELYLEKTSDSKLKLYQNLQDQKLYTKNFQAFNDQFENEESRLKLYENLFSNNLYTKDYEEFNKQFFSKEKDYYKDYDYDGNYTNITIEGDYAKEQIKTWYDIDGMIKAYESSVEAGFDIADSVDDIRRIMTQGNAITDEDLEEAVKQIQKMQESQSDNRALAAWVNAYNDYRINKKLSIPSATLFASRKAGFTGLTGVTIQSLISLANKEAAAAGLAGGVAVGGTSAYLGYGALATGGAGFMAMANGYNETLLTFNNILQENLDARDLDFTPDNIRMLLEDEDFFIGARNESLARGGTIALTEGVFAYVGGNAAGKVVRATNKAIGVGTNKLVRETTKGVASLVTATPFEMAGGMTGETLGLIIQGKELEESEILIEGLAGVTQAPVTAGFGLLSNVRPGSYKINGKKVDAASIQKIFETATDEQIAGMKIDIKGDKVLQDFVNAKKADVIDRAEINARVDNASDRQAILELKRKLRKHLGDDDFSKAQAAEIKSQIKDIESQYIKRGRLPKSAQQYVDRKRKVYDAISKLNVAESVRFAEENPFGLPTDISESTQEFNNKTKNFKFDKKQKSQIDRVGGVLYNGTIYINKETASRTKQVNVGAHELLHGILNAKVKDQNAMANGIKNLLSPRQNTAIVKQLKQRGYPENKWGEEYLTIFSDILNPNSVNHIPFEDTLFKKIGGVFIPLLRKFGYNQINFKDAKGVYEFMRDYSKSVKKGKITDDILAAVGDITQEQAAGRGVQASLGAVDSEVVNRLYAENGLSDFNTFQILEQLRPTAEGIANRYNDRPSFPGSDRTLLQDQVQKDLLVDEIMTGERGMLDVIRSYPNYVRNQSLAGKPAAPLSGYINKSFSTETGFKRYVEIADRVLGKGDESVFGTSIDNQESTQQFADKTTETPKRKPTTKIDPRDILKPKFKKAYNDAVTLDGINSDNISFKKLKGQGSSIMAEAVGIPASKLKPANNFSKGDLIKASKFIFESKTLLRKLMPKGAVLEAASDALIGTSTGVQRSLLNAFYTKQDRADNLYPHTLDKITDAILLEKAGIDKNGNPIKGLSPRSPEAQVQKAILNLADKLITNTIVREKMKKADYSANVIQDTAAGIQEAQLSVADQQLANELGYGNTYIDIAAESKKSIDDGFIAADAYVNAIKNDIIPKFHAKYPGLLNAGEFVNGLNLRKYPEVKQYLRARLNDIPELKVRGKYPKRDFAKFVGKDVKTIEKNKNKIDDYNKQAEINFDAFWKTVDEIISEKPEAVGPILTWLGNSISSKTHPHRNGALFKAYDKMNKGKVYFEHALQNAAAYRLLIAASISPNQEFDKTFEALKKNYVLIGLSYADNKKLDAAGLKNLMRLDGNWNVFDNNWWERYFNEAVEAQGGIDTNNLVWLPSDKTFLEEFNINSQGLRVSPELQLSIGEVDNNSKKLEALQQGRLRNKPEKGISVFDFDDTLAQTNSQVIVTMPDGSTNKINATEFALQSADLEAAGATFDFSEFNKVIDGKKGPLFELALRRQDKFTSKDIFILTARPQEAAYAIHAFLKGIGLEIPMSNITGLEDGRPQAKADWIIGKAAEGYNNFYFADDAYKNVKAVQDVLNQIDVKSDVQQAKVQLSLSNDFNNILEQTKGVDAEKKFSDAAARSRGIGADKFKFFLPPSAEDFVGLIYNFLGKGKQGEAQLKFFEDNLLKPFTRGIQEINSAKQAYGNNYRKLQKEYPQVKKLLSRKTAYNDFTYDAAIRVYLWDKLGYTIPGISKTDQSRLSDIVANDNDLKSYAEILNNITGKKNFPEPNENWVIGTIVSDINDITQRVGRKKYLADWIENKNEIFSKQNLNKIEATYGESFRSALEDMLYRMENGTNRQSGNNKLTNSFLNWVNNSVGAIMFFNFRSATLQTISLFNFINWSDNNPVKFGKAILNTRQYAKDFAMIFNSDMLKQRRRGLQTDVNEAEIARAMNTSNNKPAAILRYLLQKGFIPTQMADSFAIASGGATFYRNRLNTYLKQGLTQEQAEAKAFEDFAEASEKAQQSARPDMISQQQASPLGRLILAFQNTPMQYMRLTKKAFLDLKNGRGDWKTNVSKIVYYVAIQNLIFATLSNAMFGMLFDDEEEEMWDKKKGRVVNNMMDTVLRGSGVYGAIVSTIKNALMRFQYEANKDRNPDYTYVLIEAINLSPPVGSKARKLYNALQSYKFDADEMKAAGFSLDNPGLLAIGNVLSATANIPLDRAVMILNNIREASDSENEAWQRIAMLLGWNTWDVGVDPYGDIEIPSKANNTGPRKRTPQSKNVKRRTVKKRN